MLKKVVVALALVLFTAAKGERPIPISSKSPTRSTYRRPRRFSSPPTARCTISGRMPTQRGRGRGFS